MSKELPSCLLLDAALGFEPEIHLLKDPKRALRTMPFVTKDDFCRERASRLRLQKALSTIYDTIRDELLSVVSDRALSGDLDVHEH